MKVVVLGASGFIGGHVAAELHAHGHDVMGTYFMRVGKIPQGIRRRYCDLREDGEAYQVMKGADAVVMCAAVTSGAKDIVENPLRHVTDNIVMNARCFEAAYHQHVKTLVFLSSSTVYPSGREAMLEVRGEMGQPEPCYWWVGWMKRQAEKLLQGYAARLPRPMNVVSIRPGNVYGPGDNFDPDTSHMVAALVRKVYERQDPFVVWGSGQQRRDLLHVGDLARAVVNAVEKAAGYTAVNVATGKMHPIEEVIGRLFKIAGWQPRDIQFDKSKPTTIMTRALDVNKARTWLGWRAQVSLLAGLRSTYLWYCDKKSLWHNGKEETK